MNNQSPSRYNRVSMHTNNTAQHNMSSAKQCPLSQGRAGPHAAAAALPSARLLLIPSPWPQWGSRTLLPLGPFSALRCWMRAVAPVTEMSKATTLEPTAGTSWAVVGAADFHHVGRSSALLWWTQRCCDGLGVSQSCHCWTVLGSYLPRACQTGKMSSVGPP